MYRNINSLEQTWLNKLLSINFEGKWIIEQQILMSKVTSIEGYSGLVSLKFLVDKDTEKFPFKVRIPIEMTAFQKQSEPIVFLLHVIDGLVDELEIFSANGSEFDKYNIELDKVEFTTNKETVRTSEKKVGIMGGSVVDNTVISDVSKINLKTGQSYVGRVDIDGVTIEYRAYKSNNGSIFIGTYYPV